MSGRESYAGSNAIKDFLPWVKLFYLMGGLVCFVKLYCLVQYLLPWAVVCVSSRSCTKFTVFHAI